MVRQFKVRDFENEPFSYPESVSSPSSKSF